MTDEIITKLRAAILTAHDHLHAGRIQECHVALHCGEEDKATEPANITLDQAARLQVFTVRMNELCREMNIDAAYFIAVPSKTPGAFSLQAGGHVGTIRMIQSMVNQTQVVARIAEQRQARKRAEFMKRNGGRPLVAKDPVQLGDPVRIDDLEQLGAGQAAAEEPFRPDLIPP